MHVHIIFDLFLTKDGSRKSIGGVETYISNLCNVILKSGFQVSVYQLSNQEFVKNIDGVQVFGYPFPGDNKRGKRLLEKCREKFDVEKDLLIFGNDLIACPAKGLRSITIQHGIFWDIPRNTCTSELKYFAKFVLTCLETWSFIQHVSYSQKLICVDYNFVNWYRAVTPFPKVDMKVIPNFTQIAPAFEKKSLMDSDRPVKIMFARRFWDFRGTRIFKDAAKRLLAEYPNIDITLAGDGPDEKLLKRELDGYENVHFITYASHESLKIHADKDIAVVPTLASEGTSLSLLEAMSAQCAVVCTNVGGMTNIVIDGYNGLMISPDADSLYDAMKKLVEDAMLRKKLAAKAYETVQEGFSLERWEDSWRQVIMSMEDK